MLTKIIELLPIDHPVQVLDVGCGLGIDVFDLAVRIGQVNKHSGNRVVGLDFNTEMVTYCNGCLQEKQDILPSNVTIEFIKEDATTMESIADRSFDLIRSDIALQHMSIVLALTQINRVLRPNGHYVCLEGATGAGFFCKDESVASTYKSILPSLIDGGPGVRAFFELQKLGFKILSSEYNGIAQRGADLKAADPGWVKLEGVGRMVVDKKILTKEQCEDFLTNFKKAVDEDGILMLGGCQLITSKKGVDFE